MIMIDTSTSRTRHFVNFAAFTVSMTLYLAYRSSEVIDILVAIESVYVTS